MRMNIFAPLAHRVVYNFNLFRRSLVQLCPFSCPQTAHNHSQGQFPLRHKAALTDDKQLSEWKHLKISHSKCHFCNQIPINPQVELTLYPSSEIRQKQSWWKTLLRTEWGSCWFHTTPWKSLPSSSPFAFREQWRSRCRPITAFSGSAVHFSSFISAPVNQYNQRRQAQWSDRQH